MNSLNNITSPKNTISFLDITVALFLAISPILDPYILMEIGGNVTFRVNDAIVIILALFCWLTRIKLPKNKMLLILCIGMTILSAISMLGVPNANVNNQIRVLAIWFAYALLVSYIWNTKSREYFFQFAGVIASFAIVVMALQFVLGGMGIPMWDGKISFFDLSKYDGWAGYIDPNTGDIRPNSIFQEPSYFGIYILVLFAHAITNNKINRTIMYAISMIITTSLVAFMGMVIAMLYYLVARSDDRSAKKTKRRLLLIIFLLACFFLCLYYTNDSVYHLVEYIFYRIGNIHSDLLSTRMGSVRWRLIGNLSLFSEYTLWQTLFGYGTLQYASIFGVINYSNNFVNAILNYGIVGFGLFICWLFDIHRHLNKNRRIFFWLMVMIFAVDQQWFNWYFFYLLSACVLTSKHEIRGGH